MRWSLSAVVAASVKRLHTEYQSPSSLGPTRLSDTTQIRTSDTSERTQAAEINVFTGVYLVEDGTSAFEEAFLDVLPGQSAGLQEH